MAETLTSQLYRPLQKDEIRLLRLDSAQELMFTLTTIALQIAPQYAALSYTWGTPIFSETVTIDGHGFAVTANLKEALTNLVWRVKQDDCHLWIDAICINQHDSAERSSQVRIMSNIFQRSFHVFCWVGKPEDETEGAMAMAKINETGILHRDTRPFGSPLRAWLSKYDFFGSGLDPAHNMRTWEGIGRLSCQDWWIRAWIIQEATCSEATTLFYGAHSVLISHVYVAMLLLRRLVEDYETRPSLINSMYEKCIYLGLVNIRRRKKDIPGLRLRELILTVRSSQCFDARDKLYAIMSIASDIPNWLEVDYKKSVADVYIDFVRYAMETASQGSKLDFLGECGAVWYRETERVPQDVKANPLPSWVPDWRVETSSHKLANDVNGDRFYNADNLSEIDVLVKGLELWVKGFCVSDICLLGPVSKDATNPSLEMQWASQSPFTGASWAEDEKTRIHHILAADMLYVGGWPVSRGHKIDFSYEMRNQSSLTSEDRRKKADTRTSLKTSTLNRRLLLASSDHVGLAPRDAEIGDKICVFYGSPVLHVIRKNKEKPGYTFIGVSYVNGLMDGEAATLLRNGSTQEETFVLI